MPKEVITSAEKQRNIIESEHVDHATGKRISHFHKNPIVLANLSISEEVCEQESVYVCGCYGCNYFIMDRFNNVKFLLLVRWI